MKNESKHFKTVKSVFALLLTFILVFGMYPAPTFALPEGVIISDSGNDPVTSLPTSLMNGQIWTDKSVSYAGDGIFDITLRAIGQEYMVSNPKPNDTLDVVLVLDTSGSMGDDGKIGKLKTAAKNAVETLLSVNGNRVAIVEYSSSALLVRNFSENVGVLKDDIDDFRAGGGTNIQYALYLAQKTILDRPSNDNERKPVIILMSDGRPTYYYDGLYSSSKSRLGTGDGDDTNGTYVWNTILQATEVKNNIPDVRIYTIGFGVGSDAYAIATLMPTEANTSSYRPVSSYSGEMRSRIRSMEVPYYWQYGQWNESNYYSTRNDQTNYGVWTPFSGYATEPDNFWGSYSTDFTNPIDPFTRNGYNYAYFLRSRTGEEYRNITGQPIPFNHKYWEDESSITSSSAQDIFDAFVAIINELLIMKPNDKDESDQYTDVVIKDIIGSGFEVVGGLPSGLSQSGNTVTWTINGDDFEAMSPDEDLDDNVPRPMDLNYLYSVTFKVKIKDDALPGTYYTNDNSANELVNRTHSSFEVSEDNPFYNEIGQVLVPLNNTGWLTLSAPPVQASITVTKNVTGPVTNENRTFSFSLYSTQSGGTPIGEPILIDVNGASSNNGTFNFEIPYNGFVNNQATYYVQENNTSAPDYWTYDNATRKAVNVSRANPTGATSFTNSYTPKVTLIVNKVWTGGGSDTAASFDLYKLVDSDWVLVSGGHTIDTSDPTKDEVTISDLDLDTEYKIVETPMLDYTVTYSPQSFIVKTSDLVAGEGRLVNYITITNDYHKPIGKITINKVWSDEDNAAGDRPETLTFSIKGPEGYKGTKSITLTKDDDWTNVFETEVFGTYEFTEDVPLDYISSVNPQSQTVEVLPVGNRTASITFNNSYVAPKGNLTVKKVWANEDDFSSSYRPETIEINLLKDGNVVDTIELPEADATPWEHTFTDLEFGVYSVEEISMPDYLVGYSSNVVLKKLDATGGTSERSGQIIITNTFTNPKGNIIVSKTWVETGVDASVVRPNSIEINLYRNGSFVESQTLNDSNSWTWNFTGLPLDNGVYTVTESSSESSKLAMYDANTSYSGNGASESSLRLGPDARTGTASITNTYAKGTIRVDKVWVDGENPTLEQPHSAVITLHKITDLSQVETFKPEDPDMTSESPIEVDPSDEPEEQKILVGPTDEVVDTKTIIRPNNAPVIFYNLEIGDHIKYYITEDEIPFYTTSMDKDFVILNDNNQNDSFTVTNTYTDPKGSLKVVKVWDHGNNPNQPTEVTVELYEDGAYLTEATFAGEYIFTNLDLGKNYTIQEVTVPNYSTSYSGFEGYVPVKGQNSIPEGTATIKNTYIPELSNLTINKEWVGKVGGPITVTVYRTIGLESTLVGTTELNEENNWTHTFVGLEIYGQGGVRFTYSVQENGSDLSLYDTDTTETAMLNPEVPSVITITNTYAPEKGVLTISKEWLNVEEESMSPPTDFVEVRLLVNGVPEESTMILNDQNNWTVVRSELNADKTYSVEEVSTFEAFNVSYSATNITFDAEHLEKSIVVINQRTADEPSIDVNKSISNALVELSNGTATFNYSVELINNGNRTLSALKIVDQMSGPEGSALVYAPSPDQQDENGVVYELDGTLKPGEKVVFNYSVTVNLAGTYTNTATGYGYYVETEVSDDGNATAVATNPEVPTTEPPTETSTETPTNPIPTDSTPQGVVNVSFVDTNGDTLSPSYQLVGAVGNDYATTPRDILGYALVTTPENANGTFINGSLTVVYVYDVVVETITEEEPPLGEATTEAEEVIVDEGTPLGEALPQTGQLPPELYYGIGSIVTAAGVFLKRKNK